MGLFPWYEATSAPSRPCNSEPRLRTLWTLPPHFLAPLWRAVLILWKDSFTFMEKRVLFEMLSTCWIQGKGIIIQHSEYSTIWTTEESWFDSRKGKYISLYSYIPNRFWGLRILLFNREGVESWSLSSSAGIKNEWSYLSTLSYDFLECLGQFTCLIRNTLK